MNCWNVTGSCMRDPRPAAIIHDQTQGGNAAGRDGPEGKKRGVASCAGTGCPDDVPTQSATLSRHAAILYLSVGLSVAGLCPASARQVSKTRQRALHPEHTPPVAGTEVLTAVTLAPLPAGVRLRRSGLIQGSSLEVRGCTVRVRSIPHLGLERFTRRFPEEVAETFFYVSRQPSGAVAVQFV